MNNLKLYSFLLLLLGAFFTIGCHKDDAIGEDPYAGGKQPLGIFFLDEQPQPEAVAPGEVVRIHVRGLARYENEFTFYLNQMEAEVVSLTDSTIDVLVPELASTGGSSVRLKNQAFFGPRVFVSGKVSVDQDFGIVKGFNGPVLDILPFGGGYLLSGMFSDFDDEAGEEVFRNSIHFINSLGKSDATFNFQKGTSGAVNSMVRLPNGKFLVGGMLNDFNHREVMNIAQLNVDGTLDTLITPVINPTPEDETKNVDTVSAFNGGTLSGIVVKLIPTSDNGVIALGSFRSHVKIDYRYSSKDNKRGIYTSVRNVMRLKSDGSLDSAFAENTQGTSGNVVDGAVNSAGQVAIVGSFTSFDSRQAGRIVRLNADGSLDETFNVGAGANKDIFSIDFNEEQQKYVVTGNFTQFNGHSLAGIAVLNQDGSVDANFKPRDLGTGIPTFAKILNSGKILVSGGFESYDGIQRSQILFLEPDGEALQAYNNIGDFTGLVAAAEETVSSQGYPAVLIGGSFSQINGVNVENIAKLEIRN